MGALLIVLASFNGGNIPANPTPPGTFGLPYTVRWDSLSDAQQREFPTMYLAHLRGEVLGNARVWINTDATGNLCTRKAYGETPGYPY